MSAMLTVLTTALLAGCAALHYNPYSALTTPTTGTTPTKAITITPARIPTPQAPPTAGGVAACTVIAPEALNLRAGPGMHFPVTHWLTAGELLTLLDEPPQGDWIEVTTADGHRGWVNAHYCH